MRIHDFPDLIKRNFRTPSTWIGILIYGSLFTAGRLLLGQPKTHSMASELVIPYLVAVGIAALAPLPWLWTGDPRPQASPLRGLLQSIPWNLVWLVVLANFIFWVWPHVPEGHRLTKAAMGMTPPHQLLAWRGLAIRIDWGFLVFNTPFTVILGWFLAGKERTHALERELKALADQARLQALQAQLNPHALFNALSGLTELVHEDPDATEEALVGLVGLYRDLARHSAALRVPLRQEREILERYLDLEAIRLEERLQVEWDWPSWADDLELPPLLFQPLVENAIKHGISPAIEGGRVKVLVRRSPDSLVLQVANTGCPLEEPHSEGTGLGNLRARLALMPEFSPTLTLSQEGEEVVARMTLAWRWDS